MNTQELPKDRSVFLSRFVGSNPETDSKEDGNLIESEGKVKNKLLSMWNNVKYDFSGMKLRSNFSKESPVWLLGKCYRRLESPSSDSTELGTDVAAFHSQGDLVTGDDENFEAFKKDFFSRLWLTYRREFPILTGSNLSSDCGWGCMLRSGQMLMAQALVCHFLGRNWRWDPEALPGNREQFIESVNHRKIIKWFGDKPSKNSPLSIHTLVTLGEESGKKAGDWYGPGFVAHLLKKAVNIASEENYEFDALNVFVAENCTVYIGDVLQENVDADGKWKSLILLVPVRLGLEKFNSVYAPSLTALFSLKQGIGIIGGRPKHSMYFVGFQDDKLIHLDPHYCQEMVDVWAPEFPLSSFHCRSPRKLHIGKMDPSCCIGFYCSTKEEFFNLVDTVQSLIVPSGKSNSLGTEYPLFIFDKGFSRDSSFSPQRLPPKDLEFSVSSTDVDIEIEHFNLL
ncbi:cysteine protease ATG4D isoform X1 [Harmonia axyridis]|uniref:cysteine protease ATG4D isoform X1 n=1 Tax=Harmonia axyridis TaxID=115357 RepID=UPI001E2753CB|nr:cysteine protease ATG4D isoform X1 [Harmonia axyridis]